MFKKINIYNNPSFSELNYVPGEIIALDNSDFEFPSPLILTIPREIVKGYENSPHGMRLLYLPKNRTREEWTVYPNGNVLGLWSPNCNKDGSEAPNFEIIKPSQKERYVVEHALSGTKAIQEYFEQNRNLNFYSKCLKSRKLITERNQLEKFLQELGFEFILPNQIRFTKNPFSSLVPTP